MLRAEAIEKDLERAHADFGAPDLFTSTGVRITGFFSTQTTPDGVMAVDGTAEGIRILRSAQELALHSIVEDRKQGISWKVVSVQGDEGAYFHTLRRA